jgi:hypothetical protein
MVALSKENLKSLLKNGPARADLSTEITYV